MAVEFHRLSNCGGTEEEDLDKEVLSPVSVLELQGALFTTLSVNLPLNSLQNLIFFTMLTFFCHSGGRGVVKFKF